MKNIFVNVFNAKSGGGLNIATNYLQILNNSILDDNYYILINSSIILDFKVQNNKIILIDNYDKYSSRFLYFILYFFLYPKLFKKYNITNIINFGDIIIPTKIKQIYFFDWAFLLYNDSELWFRMNLKDLILRFIKRSIISLFIKYPNYIIVQTNVIKERFIEKYNLCNIIQFYTPLSINFNNISDTNIYNLTPFRYKLFFPTSYGSHKNIEILIPIINELNKLNKPYIFYITDNKIYDILSSKINKSILDKYVLNFGYLNLNDIHNLYQRANFLFFPTLLESFGLPYIEAINFNKPILTSDRDFAHEICKDSAYYFNPNDFNDIINKIDLMVVNEEEMIRKSISLKQQNKFNNWQDLHILFNTLIK